jgi:NAD(P)-dependent dehydrogenase (short-subunit alcohol dehydrogenase family)
MFAGRVALVTGAASGIGLAIADELLRQGAAVVALDKDADALARMSQRAHMLAVMADVTDRVELAAAARSVEAQFGKVDVLVVAAGILQPPPLALEDVSERQFDRIMDVNLKGAWNTLSLFGGAMAKNGSGAIVTIASITAMLPGPLVPYGPAKAALIEMTKSFAGTWGASGVRVNCVAPGFVETPALARGVSFGLLEPGRLAAQTAMGRLATVDEIARAACFLVSDNASGITGAVLPVDCGALVHAGFEALRRNP